MSADTKIEWCDATWNPVTGCDHVSKGCDNCYAEAIARRFHRPFLGAVECHEDRLDLPLRWRKPRRVFVNSVSDLFHDDVPDVFIGRVFHVMAAAQAHTFQVLTKRPQRMAKLLASTDWGLAGCEYEWPLPNVWLGVSVEDQRYADIRIPHLLATPATVRFLSVEPLLGPVDLHEDWLPPKAYVTWTGRLSDSVQLARDDPRFRMFREGLEAGSSFIDWVIVGGESGPGARPMHASWARSLRDQCEAAGVPFFFKQWGEWGITGWRVGVHDGPLVRMGKRAAGRELDGRTWDQYPNEEGN